MVKNVAKFALHLYFAGRSPRAISAMENLKTLCRARLSRRCRLRFIDLYKNPDLAKRDQIVAAPTLIKKSLLPERRMIGDLSDLNRVLAGLDVK